MEITVSTSHNLTAKATVILSALWLSVFIPGHTALAATPGLESVAYESTDSLPDNSHTLGEITVEGNSRAAVRTTRSGDIIIDAAALSTRGRAFGESDFIAGLKLMPGISTIGDYGSGISVDGADPSQTLHTIAGAPVVFPYRFGGLFSTFNTSHFSRATFSRSAHGAAKSSRLGGLINVEPPLLYTRNAGATVNVGLLSSSATLRLSDTRRWSLTASARVSYIDEIYGRFLSRADRDIKYRFYDLNLSAAYILTATDNLTLNLFHNTDHLDFYDSNYAMDLMLNWHNNLSTIAWRHEDDGLTAAARIYFTGFDNTLTLSQPQLSINAPSSLYQYGASTDGSATIGNTLLSWGAEANIYRITPQWATYTIDDTPTGSAPMHQHPADYRVAADIMLPLGHGFSLTPGLRLSGASEGGDYAPCDLSPSLTLQHSTRHHTLTLHAGRYCQYLHQVGFSEIGLASNFWTASSHRAPRQSLWDFSATSRSLLPIADLKLEVSAYYKRVFNQPEYFGNVIDIIDTDYDAMDHLRSYDGYNTGFNIDLRRETGRLTGSVNYSFGIARHKDPVTRRWFRAITETLNSLGANVDYRLNEHWNFGATFTYATGRPYTPVKAIYLIGGTIGMEYGTRNSALFPSYQRLDLSATYSWTTRRQSTRGPLSHMVNISLLNAYGHRNVDMQYFSFTTESVEYVLRRVYSLYRYVPSISYTLTF